MKNSMSVVAMFVAGCVAGAYLEIDADIHGISLCILYALMLQVGMGIGGNRELRESLRHVSPKILLVPVATITGTLLFSAAASLLLSRWSVFDCMAVGSGFAYYSQATRVRVPDDIIPGGCGEGIGVNNGVELDYADGRLVVASPDTPIAMFGGIHSRDGNKFHPGDRVEPQLWFSILNSFWNTNFAHAERDELECRFVFSRLAASPDEAAGELWSYPVRV